MRLFSITTILAAAMLGGCASIINGSTQEIAFTSQPSQATITIDGVERGTTPVSVELARGERHTVVMSLEGYETEEIALEQRVNGWVWGNILVGGLIGLVVDASTGAMYRIDPETLRTRLEPAELEADKGGLQVHIRVESNVPPGAEKIGQLHPVGEARVAARH